MGQRDRLKAELRGRIRRAERHLKGLQFCFDKVEGENSVAPDPKILTANPVHSLAANAVSIFSAAVAKRLR